MGNPNYSYGSEFQSLIYYKLCFKGEYDKNKFAAFLNLAPDTFQRKCNGKLPIYADEARKIIKCAHELKPEETEFVEFFCLPNFIPIPALGTKISSKAIRVKEIRLSILNGKALEEIEEALKDGKIDKNEYKKVHKSLTLIRESAAEIDECLKCEVK